MRSLSAALDKYGIDVRNLENWINVKPNAPATPYRKLAIEAALGKEAA